MKRNVKRKTLEERKGKYITELQHFKGEKAKI